MKSEFNIEAYRNLPVSLKKSDYVDFLLFINYDKPCVRVGSNSKNVYDELNVWCQKYKYSFRLSKSGLVYISRNRFLGILAQKADDSLFPHTIIFGLLLGYPLCCCRKIKAVGEKNIDEYEKNVMSEMEKYFVEPYDKIKPHHYIEGAAFISHIPCGPQCKRSLKIANRSLCVIKKYKGETCMKGWKSVL